MTENSGGVQSTSTLAAMEVAVAALVAVAVAAPGEQIVIVMKKKIYRK